jgi:hypothetical protein
LNFSFLASPDIKNRWSAALVQGIVRAFSAGDLVLELVGKILDREGEGSGENDEEGSEE